MRFLKNGPNIPDALLQRCDLGRVVFLCGAGISSPAGLPDFIELTRKVIEFFNPPADSQILAAFGPRIDVEYRSRDDDGLLAPLDQIFHLLHQEYGRQDVNALVAELLSSEDFTAPSHEHSLIARVSSDPEGRPQIVTTNFDRLFDQCTGVSEDRIFEPPAFPDIELGIPIYGVTYLHGRLQPSEYPHHDYILSSADFGRAYLAEGWATKFVRALLDQYTVVLVGYQAEDPPVKYLLQGLNHDGLRDTANLYAFDKGKLEDIEVKWRDRGVTPISYAEHSDLWETLEAWAKRADDPRTWRNEVVEMAQKGPRALSPHERGKVAHLVRSTPGTRVFARSDPPPTAEWLNVFDASCRAAKKSQKYGEAVTTFDPLEVYGLDDDPERAPETGQRTGRVHDHLLEWRQGDTNPATNHSLAGRQLEGWEDIPPRLLHLVNWSVKHLNSPILAWWAARQPRLHPRHAKEIERELRNKVDLHPMAANAWNLILESLEHKRGTTWDDGWYEFADRIKKEGWTNGVLRTFDETMSPVLVCKPPYGLGGSKPPEGSWDDVSLRDIANWEIKIPQRHGEELRVPEKVLPEVLSIAERHLKRAAGLHSDIGTSYFTTPTCYPGREIKGKDREGEEAEYFLWFLNLLDRMAELNPAMLSAQVLTWDHQDPFFFRKLKIFALNDNRLFDANTASAIVLNLSPVDFWDNGICRELLFLIADRWSKISNTNRIALVERFLAGPEKMGHWSEEEYPRIRDEFAARYTRWLELQGCELEEHQSTNLVRMMDSIDDWSDGWASSIVVLHGTNVGWVGTDDDPKSLTSVPTSEVVKRASAETYSDHQTHTDFRPFDGLVSTDPYKALAALSLESRKGEYPENLWRSLIQNWPSEISSRLNMVFLHRVARLPSNIMWELRHPLADWIKKSLESRYQRNPDDAWYVFDAVVSSLLSEDSAAINSGRGATRSESEVVHSSRRTYGHAINSPIGLITEGLLNALNGLKLDENSGIPKEFKDRVERLLAVPGEGGDHAVAILVRQLHWLYYLDRAWVIERIVPWFAFDHPVSEPSWNAYLSAAKFPPQEIGERLKPLFLEIFPKIYDWSWDRDLAEIAAQMVIELAILKSGEPDGLSVSEARNCIRDMSGSNRQDAISRLRLIGQREEEGWSKYVVPFIEDTWPRERKFRTSEMVSAWLNLLDHTDGEFPVVLKSILRFLVPVELESHFLHRFSKKIGDKDPLTSKHPSAMLDMLDAIVPDDPQATPLELASILALIESTEPSLARDRRYFRLIDLVERR